MTDFRTAYNNAKRVYKENKKDLLKGGFQEVYDLAFRHHAIKNFSDLEIKVFSVYRKALEDQGYAHVILYCYIDTEENPRVKLRYTLAIDPILYGLRTWYIHGGQYDVKLDAHTVLSNPMLKWDRDHVRARFRQGTTKANVRAWFTMLADRLRDIFA